MFTCRWFSLSLSLLLALMLLLFSLLSLKIFISVKPTFAANLNTVITVTTSIQNAVDLAQPGDDIFIPEGIYTESLIIDKPIRLIGAAASTTIIRAKNNQSVVEIANTVIISGVTLVGGNNLFGGGVFVDENHTITLINTVIKNNKADLGGGLFLSINSSATLTNVAFKNNEATFLGGGIYLDENNYVNLNAILIEQNSAIWGGGMYINKEGSGMLSSVILRDNVARSGANTNITNIFHPRLKRLLNKSSVNGDGGGLYLDSDTSIDLVNVTIQNNKASLGRGGGIFVEDSRLTLDSSTLQDNEAERGGGIYLKAEDTGSTMTNNFIIFNKAITGGAIYIDGGGREASHKIINNTIIKNTINRTNSSKLRQSARHFGGIYCEGPNVTLLVNLILWDNGIDIGGEDCPNNIEYSMVGKGISGVNNNNITLFSNPKFANAAIGDFHLLTDSLAIDRGKQNDDNENTVPNIDFDSDPRPQGEGIDIGADETPFSGPTNNGITKVYLSSVSKSEENPPPEHRCNEIFEPNQDDAYRGALACKIDVNMLYNTMFANDADDWYYIELTSTKYIIIEVTNYPYPDVEGQLILYAAFVDDLADKSEPFLGWWNKVGGFTEMRIPEAGSITLGPGKYFIRVWSDPNCGGCSGNGYNSITPYTLHIFAISVQ